MGAAAEKNEKAKPNDGERVKEWEKWGDNVKKAIEKRSFGTPEQHLATTETKNRTNLFRWNRVFLLCAA